MGSVPTEFKCLAARSALRSEIHIKRLNREAQGKVGGGSRAQARRVVANSVSMKVSGFDHRFAPLQKSRERKPSREIQRQEPAFARSQGLIQYLC